MINDYLGHEAGDKVLQLVSNKLLHCLKAEGIVSRIGGDEFGMILTKVKTEECVTKLAKEILAALIKDFK